MNRCLQLFLVCITFALTSPSAQSQDIVRQTIPANAVLGVLQVSAPPEVLMDGMVDRLSPGARIRAENNMMVLSGALSGQSLLVAYVREPNGLLHEIWILNAAERAAVLKRQQANPSSDTKPTAK